MTTAKKKTGRPTAPRIHRYNFKLTTEENIRFEKMLSEAGLEHNRSRFIVKRLFAERFEGIHRVPRFSVQERRQFNFLVPYHRILSVILPIFL